jgi:hypothetical protein
MGENLSDLELQGIVEHLSFDKMKANPSVNFEGYAKRAVRDLGVTQQGTFMRRGVTGSWKTEIPPHLLVKLDSWIEKNGIPGLYEA